MNICTIIAKNYLAHARVLARSFGEHHPDGTCFVLVIDEVDGYVDAAEEPFELVRPEQIGLGDAWDEMRGAYDVMELSTAVKPWLLRHMLDRHDDGSGVAYFDPDIRVVSRMVELEDALGEHAVVLTPHVTKGMPRDGLKPTEQDILMAGVYNLGFIGLSDRPDARLLLDWWSERLRRDCHVAPERGFFVDQRWVDFVPGLVDDLLILRHAGYNVAYWNLAERRLSRDAEGALRSNDEPLRFFHFSGYSPDLPDTLSKHQNRVQIADVAELADLCDAYGAALVDSGFHDVRALPYEHDVLPSGLRLIPVMRSLYRLGLERDQAPGTLFTQAGESDFLAWLREPSREQPALSRLLAQLWLTRADLQVAYPDVGGADFDGFMGWCVVHGTEQIGIDPTLIPPDAVERFTPLREQVAAEVEVTTGSPRPELSAPATDASTAPEGFVPSLPFGVNLAGYLRAELGIGEVARQLIRAFDAASVPVLPIGLYAPLSRQGHGYAAASQDDQHHFPVNVVCVNADGLPAFAEEVGPAFFDGRYTIGVWWWETSDFPERFHGAFDLVDEIWAGSRFVAETLSGIAPVPVIHVPLALDVAQPPPLAPGELGWPDGFSFYFSYDYNSVTQRKNPLGLVDAYCRAFDPQDGAHLVLKCINHEHRGADHQRVLEAIAGRPDILVIDRYVSADEKSRLMSSCDAYVSLHRSEGFGLTMAEAMLFGKPVIATRYSGNLDFMDDGNSYLVDHELVPVGAGAAPYEATGTWADPDLDHAARLMREVFDDRDAARARGARAAADVRARYSPLAAGAAVKARLDVVAGRLPAAVPVPQPPNPEEAGVQALEGLVRQGSVPRSRSRFGRPGSAVRKLVLRTIKPYTAYQATVNRTLVEALRASLEREAAADAIARRRAVEIEARAALGTATVLAEQRRLSAVVEAARVAQMQSDFAARTHTPPTVVRMLDEIRALPYMAEPLFVEKELDGVGRVLGYDDADGQAAGIDAYRTFEDLFRGSEEFIADRQRRYLPLVEGRGPIVDVGCGRGEFLDVLAEAGVAATGVDSDEGMVARCREKGHDDVVHGDGVAYIEQADEASLGTVFSAQVVEHLPSADLTRFLDAAAVALRPGGSFIAETVNPHSVPAMKTFWMDITHQHPLFPEAMLALCRSAGFTSAYVFHPNGTGDVETDRFTTGEYAVVATR